MEIYEPRSSGGVLEADVFWWKEKVESQQQNS